MRVLVWVEVVDERLWVRGWFGARYLLIAALTNTGIIGLMVFLGSSPAYWLSDRKREAVYHVVRLNDCQRNEGRPNLSTPLASVAYTATS